MFRLEVSDQDKDALKRMTNSRPWMLLMLSVKEECQIRRKNIMSGSHDDFTNMHIDIARFNAIKDFVSATYAAAEQRIPPDLETLFN